MSSHLRTLLSAVVVVLAIAATGVLAYEAGYFAAPPPVGGPALMQATCATVANSTRPVEHVASGGNGEHAYFLIVEADPPSPYAGINGSYYVPANQQWPTLYVKQGQTVSIHVINCASSEVHGFQVQSYDESTLNAVQSGRSYDVTFTASRTGTFRVYCGIPCSIHPRMQNGALIVT